MRAQDIELSDAPNLVSGFRLTPSKDQVLQVAPGVLRIRFSRLWSNNRFLTRSEHFGISLLKYFEGNFVPPVHLVFRGTGVEKGRSYPTGGDNRVRARHRH
ncbi:MAG: hypothetical protein ACI8X5_002158 [Planctomycetota bacterium]|jgi:hypothetical protein